MSPRPRRVSDDDVLDAAERMMAARGPVRLTLDHVAREVGVSAPALSRRFGSKRALLLAVSARQVRRAQAAAQEGLAVAPLEALFALLERAVTEAAPSPDALANAYAFLHVDLGDAEKRALILEQVAAIRGSLRSLVGAVVAAGELRGDVHGIADLLEAVYNGALVGWLVDREGPAWGYVRPRLERLLAPYRGAPAGASGADHHGAPA
jgi:AcrR family transcriptional regulator